MENREIKTVVMIVVVFMLMLFSGIAWLNNIYVSIQWYDNIQQEIYVPIIDRFEANKEQSLSGHEKGNNQQSEKTNDEIVRQEDKTDKEKKPYRHFFSFLKWTVIDISTVTTFIPFFGLLLIFLGLIRSLKKGKISDDFPYFPSYNRSMIALGLIGTLWGIIMIGYYPSGDVQMDNLLLCLHTALYSTLVAVAWVFIIGKMTNVSMKWWHMKLTGKGVSEELDIIEAINLLGQTAGNTKEQLNQMKSEASNTSQELKKTGQSLEEFRKRTGVDAYEAIKVTCVNISATLTMIMKIFSAQKKIVELTAENQKTFCEKYQGLVDKLQQTVLKDMNLRKDTEKRTNEVRGKLNKMREALDGFKF